MNSSSEKKKKTIQAAPEAEPQFTHKDQALISQIAHMYYDLDMLQPEIAEQLFFSRSKVSRLLKAARELGIVEIKVHQVFDRADNLEQKLRKTFHLKDAIVVTCFNGSDTENSAHATAEFAARYISDLIEGPMTVGITNGHAMHDVVSHLTQKHNAYLNVLQLMGSVTSNLIYTDPKALLQGITGVYPGITHYLNAPIRVGSPELKKAILEDPVNRDVFGRMNKMDLLLTGIGKISLTETSKWYTYQTKEQFNEIKEKGAVGCICGQYYTVRGQVVDCEWNKTCIAYPLTSFYKVKNSIGVADGKVKTDAIIGALAGHFINILATDSDTAYHILKRYEELKTPDFKLKFS